VAVVTKLLLLGLVLVWLLFPVWGAVLLELLAGRWMLQESPRAYCWMALTTVFWLVPVPWVLPKLWAHHLAPHNWKVVAGVIAMGLLAGIAGGGLLVVVVNCAFDRSTGEEVPIQQMALLRTSVKFKINSGDHAGLVFYARNARWGSIARPPAKVILHRGRLGLYWCQARE
jgi:hypothetical protein